VTDDERTKLIHAELDGELDSTQRADLARLLLAEPQTRALRDQLQGLRSRLDAVGQIDPPPELKDSILKRLPSTPAQMQMPYPKAALSRWRLAALIAGLVTAGSIVYETVQGPGPGSRETAGTMVAEAPVNVDSVVLDSGPVTGRASLYRDRTGLAVGLELSALEPVEVLIASGGRSFRIKGLVSSNPGGIVQRTVALPGVGVQGQDVELEFLVGERTVSRASLHAPSGP
jgi:hypothetical protein